LRIDFRFADPDRLAAYAEELVNLRPDLIFADPGPAARAVQQRTAVIPIVFVGGGDAADGLIGNIARPGGNMTGFAANFGSLGGKWLELLKEAAPGLTSVAHVISANEFNANRRNAAEVAMDAAAARLGVTIVRMRVHDTAEIEPAVRAVAAAPNGGLLVTGAAAPARFEAISQLALQHRLPLMIGAAAIVAEGVLMSHSPDRPDLYRGAASYADRILRGANPGELPVQYPTKFELVVNLKTAKALGITVPQSILLRADEVIE
jgi:putative ABC transport system substrate-binding protein